MIGAPGTVSNAPSGTEYAIFIQLYGYNTQLVLTTGVKTRRYVGSPPNWTSWT